MSGIPAIGKRVGARRRSEIPSATLVALNKGSIETANLVEMLAINFTQLLKNTCPTLPKASLKTLLLAEGLGITKRMALAGQVILEHGGFSIFESLSLHRSDIVRSWACYLLGSVKNLSLAKRLKLIKPLANDSHSGVREWAWIAIRPLIANEVKTAITLLEPWVDEDSEYLRRFAVEITRPRGVWCSHIEILKQKPSLGLPLLNPLKSDGVKYVQDSVANWLNDAFKSNPDWVRARCALWKKQSVTPETLKICKRALRNDKQ